MNGEVMGSFIVTSIPEPGTAAYLGGSVVLLWRRKACKRKANGVGREGLG
jgi:hypothetical protein